MSVVQSVMLYELRSSSIIVIGDVIKIKNIVEMPVDILESHISFRSNRNRDDDFYIEYSKYLFPVLVFNYMFEKGL